MIYHRYDITSFMATTRTIITLPKEDKAWLEDYGHKHHQSMAEIIRYAISFFRKNSKKNSRKALLKETSGLWKHKEKDALELVNELRNEWDK